MERAEQSAAINLEKSMLFIPNRLHVRPDELYVSFNIAVIPEDMDVVRLSLRLQLPERSGALSLSVHAIAEAWDEQSIRNWLPRLNQQPIRISIDPPDLADSVDPAVQVTHFAEQWRFRSDHNHGLCVRLHGAVSEDGGFSEERPPYLLADTL